MTGERTARALARIDAATRRIQLAAQGGDSSSDAGMESRYQALWSQTNAALAELDQLIGSLER